MRRATSAKQYLVGLGIDANRIDMISYGLERPVDSHHNEKAWALNRRDDFVRAQAVSAR
jgi:peptidoglycan-associated lipoprotein